MIPGHFLLENSRGHFTSRQLLRTFPPSAAECHSPGGCLLSVVLQSRWHMDVMYRVNLK